MSLDVSLTTTVVSTVWTYNITHNLTNMAMEADLYYPLWRPEEIGITTAEQLIPRLRAGLMLLKAEPERYRAMNPANGWGTYEDLLEFVTDYLAMCEQHPQASLRASA